MWVSPFRYPRIVEYLLLPVAFRSLSRLSSALSAKASTLRSYQLNLLTSGAGCSLNLRLQRQTLRSWFLTFGFFIFFNEVFENLSIFYLLFGCLYLLQIQIFCLYSVFKVQFTIVQHSQWIHKCFALCFNALLIASVEMVRFELMTPCLQGRCSPN